MNANVCNTIVLNNLCCGCGVCVDVCPSEILEMQFNRYGEYNPIIKNNKCKKNCNLCLRVCPFSEQAVLENNIAKELWSDDENIFYHEAIGFYIRCYCGYVSSENLRINSASGGLLTWLLQKMLQEHIVDYVVCVRPCKRKEKLFEFSVCRTTEEVRKCSKSCYYPVEISSVLKYIRENDGRYAITGLPCFIYSLRLVFKYKKIFDKRILYTFGLVCGQQKSKFFAEYICALGGGNPNKLTSLQFRVKNRNRPASDYGLFYSCEDGSENTVYWTEGMSQAWCERYFTLNACNYCDDLFAELADATFMDAWLPQYSKDYRGTSIVVVRNKLFQILFEEGIQRKDLNAEVIDVNIVIASQQGALAIKRERLAERFGWALKRGKSVISKRVQPKSVNIVKQLEFDIEYELGKASKRAFLEQKYSGYGLNIFNKKMKTILRKKRLLQSISKVLFRIKRKILFWRK